jgi:Cd2+/Zn2+-exporting ATPase
MKIVLKLEKLTCANCARKIEEKASKLEGVKDVKLDFIYSCIILTLMRGIVCRIKSSEIRIQT